MTNLAEGVETTESAYELGKRLGVDTPITDVVYEVIYRGKGVLDAMVTLQSRSLKDEWYV
jgi:glycerol-3-phosphate dehydrogenase (NAD(P)+)